MWSYPAKAAGTPTRSTSPPMYQSRPTVTSSYYNRKIHMHHQCARVSGKSRSSKAKRILLWTIFATSGPMMSSYAQSDNHVVKFRCYDRNSRNEPVYDDHTLDRERRMWSIYDSGNGATIAMTDGAGAVKCSGSPICYSMNNRRGRVSVQFTRTEAILDADLTGTLLATQVHWRMDLQTGVKVNKEDGTVKRCMRIR